jgi:hypothetical protein
MPVKGLHQNFTQCNGQLVMPFKKYLSQVMYLVRLSSLWTGGRECSPVKTGKSLESINMAESGYLSNETAGIRH